MNSGLITVVVPVYKEEKYLDQCVESLLAQSYSNLEIILVDDGSPDRCPELCDAWAAKDQRIRVIHQKNAGLGPARNSGIQVARGEYLAFVDSDDWVAARMYERLYEAAKESQADIIVGGNCRMVNGTAVQQNKHPMAGTVLSGAEEILPVRKKLYGIGLDEQMTESFPMSACMSLYRRSMLEKHQIHFRNLISEDIVFNLMAYGCADKIVFTDGMDYCNRKEGQPSITRNIYAAKKQQYQTLLSVLSSMAAQEDEDCQLRVKRTVIDCYRIYTGAVGNSSLPYFEKRKEVAAYAQMPEIRKLWLGYPTKSLPLQQRIFHWMISHKQYDAALALHHLRQRMRKKDERG